MDAYEEHRASSQTPYVLVVDDVATTRAMHSLMLSRQFEVKSAASGQEALQLCAERLPDLVLLDVEMPGLNGFDTCRALRRHYDIPIIFATSHESLDEHLKAFDAGASDLCVKPVSAEILLRKVRLAITQWRERAALRAEKDALQTKAEQYQSSMSERRLLLQFVRTSLSCENPAQLAQNFLHACRHLGVQCCIAIRHEGGESAWSLEGEASALERAVLARVAGMGQLVQFKNRLALSHERLSVVVSNMPDEASEEATRIRENMSALVEMAAALADHLAQRSERPAGSIAEPLEPPMEALPGKMAADIRLLLQEILDRLESAFDLMSTDRHQEERIMHAVRDPLERILVLLNQCSDQSSAPVLRPPGD